MRRRSGPAPTSRNCGWVASILRTSASPTAKRDNGGAEPANHTANRPAPRHRRSRALRGRDRCGDRARRRTGTGAGGAGRPAGGANHRRRRRGHAVPSRRQESARAAPQCRGHCATDRRGEGRSRPCQEPGARLERTDRGAAGAGAVRHDVSWGLRGDQRGEAALQQRDGARRRRHRQLALHGRSDRPALRHRSRPHGGYPPRHRSQRVRSRSHWARAGCRLAREVGRDAGRARDPAGGAPHRLEGPERPDRCRGEARGGRSARKRRRRSGRRCPGAQRLRPGFESPGCRGWPRRPGPPRRPCRGHRRRLPCRPCGRGRLHRNRRHSAVPPSRPRPWAPR